VTLLGPPAAEVLTYPSIDPPRSAQAATAPSSAGGSSSCCAEHEDSENDIVLSIRRDVRRDVQVISFSPQVI
jgi:hypothetical protein